MKIATMIAAMIFTAGVVHAADVKVGIVDVQRAVQSTAAGKKAKETLDSEFKKRKEDLDKKKADIDKMGQDLEKKRSVLSEEVFNKRQMELQEEMLKFQKTVGENQVEIQKKEKGLVEPILEKMRKVINKVSQEKGMSLVLEKQGQNVLFNLPEIDLTDEVIKTFEKEK